MSSKKLTITVFYLIFCCILMRSEAQNHNMEDSVFHQNIRRHYLIAIDISGSFTKKLKYTPTLKRAIIDLFRNKIPTSSVNENSVNIHEDQKNKRLFFNPDLDDISYFQFGITINEKRILEKGRESKNKNKILADFLDKFIENKDLNWSSFKAQNPSINEYIDSIFSKIPYSGFGQGVTLSNYVYPLVTEKINSKRYANEYVLLIVSDFLSGSDFGNKNDFNRLLDTYNYTYASNPSKDTPPIVIRNYINQLSNTFFQIEYFEYAFKPIIGNKDVGIIGYKIKPKAGKNSPEDISIFIDGSLELEQLGYLGSTYNLSNTYLRFTHNEKLSINEILISVKTNTDSTYNPTHNYQMATRENETNLWTSKHADNDMMMAFDSLALSYYIAELKNLPLHERKLGNVNINYTVNTSYKPFYGSNHSINYAFRTERNLGDNEIFYKSNFKSKLTAIMIMYVLPFAILFILLYVLILKARPKKIVLQMGTKLNDSYEEINYHHADVNRNGRHLLPYLRWGNDKTMQNFIIKGQVKQGNRLFRKLWRTNIFIQLSKERTSPGFEVYLTDRQEETRVATEDNLKLTFDKNGNFEFNALIEKEDTLAQVNERHRFEFAIEASYNRSFFIFSKFLKTKPPLDYSFYIGPELGNVWVGIDPGTTGSCIAVGADGCDVFIPKDKDDEGNDLIIPSMITFLQDATNEEMRENETLPFKEKRYYYGELAKNNSTRDDYGAASFRSIKKMLGYTNKERLEFTKDPQVTHELDGKDLCDLLIKGMYSELRTAVNGRREYLVGDPDDTQSFEPKRAIVAIPNNFTATKIQDMIDSIRSLQQFDEVRCIYEAEANLIYYLFGENKITEDANVLLFDMGGATINATLVSIKVGDSYDIDIIGKLGYGIGGDTIDYVILKYIEKHLKDMGIYVTPFNFKDNELRNKLIDLAYDVKLEIIENHHKQKEFLINPEKLITFIREAFGTNVEINQDSNIMKGFIKTGKTYPFFKEDLIQKLLYKNVKDVVEDLKKFSPDTEINHLIFSGRSVTFPLIQETVTKAVGENELKVHLIENKLKSAVALGACFYGMNRGRIKLNTTKVNSYFGVKRNTAANEFEVIELIKSGTNFKDNGEGLRKLKKRVHYENDFGFDGSMVNFYQIMGSDPVTSFEKKEKHKYSLLQQARIEVETEGVGIEVSENDNVICEVKEQGMEAQKYTSIIKDSEVQDANEKHYTWIIE